MPPKKEHDDWFRSFGIDPDAYLIDKDAATAAPAKADSATVIDKIGAALAELDAQSKRLKEAGIDPRFLDMQIVTLRKQFDALTAPSKPPDMKLLMSLQKRTFAALREGGHDAVGQMTSATKGTGKALHDLLTAASVQIEKITDDPTKQGLTSRAASLEGQLTQSEKITDPAKQKAALAPVGQAVQTLFKEAAAAASATAKSPKEKAAADMQVQQAYRTALQDKFGIVVDDPAKTTKTTHLDKVYEALEKAPVDNVVHDKLTNLAFNKGAGAYGLYNNNMIVIGQFGEKTGDWDYIEPEPDEHPESKGAPIKAERMSAVVLHELGHSVDARWGVMAQSAKPSCGGWDNPGVDKVAAVLTTELISEVGNDLAAATKILQDAVNAALTSSKIEVPEALAATSHGKAIEKFLTRCRDLRADKTPWDRPWEIGKSDRCYHESVAGQWVSYSNKSRTSSNMTVSKYQWRAPAEWFAELYAFTYMQQRKAPKGVDASAASYMFQKSSPSGASGT
jgi:hypothetical protein